MQNNSFVEREILPFLKKVLDELFSLLAALKFDKENPQHLYSICLYSTVFSLSRSGRLLIENKNLIAFPILLRSLVEAHVDLLNVIKDSTYHKEIMYLSYLCEKKRLLKNAKANPDNPYFEVVVCSGVDKRIKEVEKEIESINGNCSENLSIWKRFSKANLGNEYQSVYWSICLDTHNNIYALEKRHIKKSGENYEVFFEKEELLDNWLRYADVLLGSLVDSSLQIHSFLETTVKDHVAEIKERLSELRSCYPNDKTSATNE